MADVLIADDSGYVRRLLRDVLGAEHEVVAEVENGVEAVEVFKERGPDVAVMGASMPIRDGIEATADIKTERPDASVLVRAETGSEETTRTAREAGADGIITEPFRGPDVLAAIRDAVSS